MKCRVTIDGREVEARAGQTVLEVARQIGMDIPTLCFLEQCRPATSCLVCLVKIRGRMVPSCATRVESGMVVESETAEVHEARRTALELLFSDHVGDCQSPCQRICPLQLNIPVMLRQVQGGRLKEAIVTVKSALAMPAVLGRLCHHPCENGCRRNNFDQSAAIRELERHVADADLDSPVPYQPPCKAATGKSVAIIGAGPAGLAAAYYLAREGHACTVVDRHSEPGGSLRSEVEKQTLPAEVLQKEIGRFEPLGVRFMLNVELGKHIHLDGLARGFDAVLVTIGGLAPDHIEPFGLTRGPGGIQVDPQTSQTCRPGVFAAGSAVRPVKQLIRAMGEGQSAAYCVHLFLTRQPIQRREKPFSSVMGRLAKGEIDLFLKGVSQGSRILDLPGGGGCATGNCQQASSEANRCLHCDCRSAGHCALQHYAEVYQIDFGRFRSQRRRFEQTWQPGGVIFERGKCILCGICVQLTEQAREPLGLTFVGRGFDVRISAPLNHTISEGLQRVAQECVEKCPTGALFFSESPPPAPVPAPSSSHEAGS